MEISPQGTKMIYCFDIDGTICEVDGNNYKEAAPYEDMIAEVNKLYNQGHMIKYFTARGSVSGIDWTDFTTSQLEHWGAKYHELIMNRKPHYDLLIDDKAVNALKWRAALDPQKGLIAGSFDLIHPGYIKMFQDAKTVCDYLIVALQDDPTIDRPGKNRPVQTKEERQYILESIKYIDEVVFYNTEEELNSLLRNTKHDVRILGSEYRGTQHNGYELKIPVYYHAREHDWSCSALKEKIKNEN
jgi:glycerol-3-phosphate cytidylyltransferase